MHSAAGTLFGGERGLTRLHHTVTRVGAAASIGAALLFLTVGVITGSRVMYLQASGPVIVAIFTLTMIAVRRERAEGVLVGSWLSVAVAYDLFGADSTVLPATVALIVVAALGALFVERRVKAYLAVGGFAVTAVPIWWIGSVTDGLAAGLTAGICFVVAAVLILVIRRAAHGANRRYLQLFERVPVAVMEQDWTRVIAWMDDLRDRGVSDLRSYLDSNPDEVSHGVSMMRISHANRATARLLGVSSVDQILGPFNPDRVTDVSRPGFTEQLVAIWHKNADYEAEFHTTTLHGRDLWTQLRWMDAGLEGEAYGDFVVVTASDITAVKQAEQRLTGLVRSKNEFIASVSHELRTPLTAVVGLAAELARSGNAIAPGESDELIELIAMQSREVAYIVEDLLVAARADIGTVTVLPEPVDATAEVAGLIGELDEDGGWTLDVAASCPPVLADPVRFRQVLRNLLVNAQRYGGSHRKAVVGSAGDRVWVEVRDDGIAIPEELRDQVFEPYVRAHDSPGLTASVGLGLSVSRQLTELMGGDLSYDHTGQESVFRVELPALVNGVRIQKESQPVVR